MHFASVKVVHPYNGTYKATAQKKSRFISSEKYFPCDRSPVNSNPHIFSVNVDFAFSRRDVAAKIYKLVY